MRISRIVISAAIAVGLSLTPAAAGFAQPEVSAPTATSATQSDAAIKTPTTLKEYKNCTALQKKYPHGVGKKGAKDKVRGSTKPVKTFAVNTKVYNQNKKSDRDKDGVACEKK